MGLRWKYRYGKLTSITPEGAAPTPAKKPLLNDVAKPCIHLGAPTGEVKDCTTCGGTKSIPLHHCALHGQCTVEHQLIYREGGFNRTPAWCRTCKDYSGPAAAAQPAKPTVIVPPSAPFKLEGTTPIIAGVVTTANPRASNHDVMMALFYPEVPTPASLRAAAKDRVAYHLQAKDGKRNLLAEVVAKLTESELRKATATLSPTELRKVMGAVREPGGIVTSQSAKQAGASDCSCCSSTVTVPCCTNPIPTTLYATVSGCGCFDGSYPLTWIPTQNNWFYDNQNFNCDGQIAPFSLAFLCKSDPTEFELTMGCGPGLGEEAYATVGGDNTCSPLDITFSNWNINQSLFQKLASGGRQPPVFRCQQGADAPRSPAFGTDSQCGCDDLVVVVTE